MSFVAAAAVISTAATIGSKAYQGYQAGKVDTGAAVGAAKELSFAEIQQMKREQDQAISSMEKQKEFQMDTLQRKGEQSMWQVFEGKQAAAKTGFEGDESMAGKMDRVRMNIHQDYSTNVDKIMADIEDKKQKVSLSGQKQRADIAKRLEGNITQATSVADTFWEGFTGQGDYEVK